jgi:hypothetical protein
MSQSGTQAERTIPAREVSIDYRDAAIDEAQKVGNIVLQCGTAALDGHQILILNPTDTEDSTFLFDWSTSQDVDGASQQRFATGCISQVAYEGVKRRQGRLTRRTYLEVPTEEIAAGDRVIVRIGDERFYTEKVRAIKAQAVEETGTVPAAAAQLVLSAE